MSEDTTKRVEHEALKTRRAGRPFQFWTCIESCEPLEKQAKDPEELLAIIETAPPACLVRHTQTCALRHPLVNGHGGECANDLAFWITQQVGDSVLGLRLGQLDSFAYPDIERLRIAILSIMADHLSRHPHLRKRRGLKPLDLYCSHVTEERLHREAWTLEEFRGVLSDLEMESVYVHACLARVSKPRRGDDFSHWIGDPDGLGLPKLSAQVQAATRLDGTLQLKQQRILLLCDLALGLT